MLKKTIKFTDYDGVERTEDYWFNLNKVELMKLEMDKKGGLAEMLKRAIASGDNKTIADTLEDIIKMSYGERDLADKRRFIKSPELTNAFMQTEAYSELYMELLLDDRKAAEFINGLIPKDLAQKVAEYVKANPNSDVANLIGNTNE